MSSGRSRYSSGGRSQAIETWPEIPDFATASDAELREAVRKLQREEQTLSFRRRLLHGRIAVLESELDVRRAVRRLDDEPVT